MKVGQAAAERSDRAPKTVKMLEEILAANGTKVE